MYRYTIGEDEWEDYRTYEVLHREKYTKEEFLNICKEAFKKLNDYNKKEIIEGYGSQGGFYVVDILVKDYGFIEPEKIMATIHLCNLYDMKYPSCDECPYSYYFNGEFKCNDKDCEYKFMMNIEEDS